MKLDRKKHDIDVLERVLGTADDNRPSGRDAVELDVRQWFVGTTTSIVEMTILDRADEPPDATARRD